MATKHPVQNSCTEFCIQQLANCRYHWWMLSDMESSNTFLKTALSTGEKETATQAGSQKTVFLHSLLPLHCLINPLLAGPNGLAEKDREITYRVYLSIYNLIIYFTLPHCQQANWHACSHLIGNQHLNVETKTQWQPDMDQQLCNHLVKKIKREQLLLSRLRCYSYRSVSYIKQKSYSTSYNEGMFICFEI